MGVYDDLIPIPTVNLIVAGIVTFVVTSTFVGYSIDKFYIRTHLKGPASDRPRGWVSVRRARCVVLGMLFSSYTLLIPGLFYTIFAYQIAVMNGMKVMSERNENMLEFAQELFTTGSVMGCVAVVVFAMVLPTIKLILLISGGILRHSDDVSKRAISRHCVLFVQRISKWASPDMFAYILLTYLIRGLNHPPMLNGKMDLSIGFSCFSTFCIASTISSLGVRAPSKQELGIKEHDYDKFHLHTGPVLLATILLFVVFAISICFGLLQPCMALRLDLDLLFASGKVDPDLRPIIEALGIAKMAANDVSLFQCTVNMYDWTMPSEDFPDWEANSCIAFLLMSVLVVLFTLFDMLVLLYAAAMMHWKNRRPHMTMDVAHVLRKLSMLDVAIAGVIVINLAGRIYQKSGVIVQFRLGLLYLAIAEACHYAAFYLITVMSKTGSNDSRDTMHQVMKNSSEEHDDKSDSSDDESSD